jgi:hypothetical protein
LVKAPPFRIDAKEAPVERILFSLGIREEAWRDLERLKAALPPKRRDLLDQDRETLFHAIRYDAHLKGTVLTSGERFLEFNRLVVLYRVNVDDRYVGVRGFALRP